MNRVEYSLYRSERGESLLSVLMALLLSAVALTASSSFFIASARHSVDLRSGTSAQMQASILLDLFTSELRMMGSGMPLTQTSFTSADASLGDAPLPVLLSATGTSITFRFNPDGASAVLLSDFTPTAGSGTIAVSSSAGFAVGDTIYLSSYSAGGPHGARATITAIAGTSIQIGAIVTATGATFPASSLVQPVTEVTYTSTDSGVIRSTDHGEEMTIPNASFSLTFLDQSQQQMTLPLTPTSVSSTLAAINVTVEVQHTSRFLTDPITTTAQQLVALRNLNLL